MKSPAIEYFHLCGFRILLSSSPG
jgi:hypothetical protein